MSLPTPKIRDARDHFITAVLLIVALAIILFGSQTALNSVRVATITLYSYLEQPLSSFKAYKNALETNVNLRRQNVMLLDELSRLRSAAKQNERLRRLLDFKERTTIDIYPVEIVGKELTGIHNFLTINSGSNDSILVGMPVINSDGLIGKVIHVSPKFSQVMPFYSNLYRVSAVVDGKQSSYGIVSWEGSNYTELVMDYVPRTIQIDSGDVVKTSGYSNQYPSDIPIGIVQRVEARQGRETQRIYLKPNVSLFEITEGFVARFEPDSSRQDLRQLFYSTFK